MAAAALPLALSPLGGGEGGGDTTPPTKIQRGPPGCCSPTKRRRRRPRSGPRPLRRTLTTGAANFPLFFGREDPHPIHGDPPSSHSGSPPAPPLPAPLPPRIRQCKSSQSQQAGPHPARPRGLGAAVSPFPSTDPPMPSRQRGPRPRLTGVVGLRSPPPPNIRAAARPPGPPPARERRRGRRGGAAGNLPPSPGANRPMQTLPELQRRRAAPTSSARLRRADPRGARGCSADRPPPGLSLHFSPPPPVPRSTLSLAGRARRRHCGGGKGYSGNSSSAKMPSPRERSGGTVPAGRGLREARAAHSPECVHVGGTAARGAPPAHTGFPRRPERPTPQRGEAPAPSSYPSPGPG